jgi:hypothetical protein
MMTQFSHRKARQATTKLLEMIDDGLLSERNVLLAALNYLSEADVLDMAEREGYFETGEDEEEEEDDDPLDDFNYVGSRHHY